MKKRILIVDDDKLNLAIMSKALGETYELATAESGEAGLETLKEFGPDLVLLDFVMPGIDGYEVCRRIKSAPNGALTPVILVSGHLIRGSPLGPAPEFVV